MIVVSLFHRIRERSGRFPQWLRVTLLCLAVLIPALGLTYGQVLLSDRANLSGGYDIYREIGPLSYFMDYSVHHGDFPLWNPLTLCGMPYAANPVTSCFYPGNLIRSLLTFHPTPLKTQIGWLILAAIHLLLTGVGIVFLAREHRLGYPAAFLAAIAFLFSAIWVRRTCEYHFLTMIAWFPWLLLLTRRAMTAADTRTRLTYACVGALCVGAALLSGALNIAPYFCLAIGLYAVLYCLLVVRRETVGNDSSLAKTLVENAVFLAVVFVLGGLIASALLLPASELSSFSARSKENDYQLARAAYDGTATDLYHSLVRYPGTKYRAESIRGIGVGALLLVLAGLAHRQRRTVILYVGLFLALLDCSLGPPFPLATLVEWIAPIQLIGSTRAFDFALLPLAMLAGFGLDVAMAPPASRTGRVVLCIILLLSGVIVLRSLAQMIGPDTFVSPSWLGLLVPALTLCLIVLACWIRLPLLFGPALLVLLFAETLVWNRQYVPYLVKKPRDVSLRIAPQHPAGFWPDNRRGTDPLSNRHLYELRAAMNGYEPAYIERVRNLVIDAKREKLYRRVVSHRAVTENNQRGNLFLKRSLWLARQWVRGPLPGKESLYPAATTVFLNNTTEIPVDELACSDLPESSVSGSVQRTVLPSLDMRTTSFRIKTAFESRFRLQLPVSAAGRPPGPAGAVHSALSLHCTCDVPVTVETRFRDRVTGAWQYGKAVSVPKTGAQGGFIEIPLPDFADMDAALSVKAKGPEGTFRLMQGLVLSDENDEDGLIRILSRTADSLDLELDGLEGLRVLTFLDAAYPGWQAFVDGEQVPILLANDAFKAIVVPPGNHYIRFVFRPKRVYFGVIISCISAGIAAIGACSLHRARAGTSSLSEKTVRENTEAAVEIR